MEVLTDPEPRQRRLANKKWVRASIAGHFFVRITLSAALIGCTSSIHWHLTDVSGHLPNLKFALASDSGNLVTAKTFKGKLVLMYFGFTSCVAECPITMSRLSHVLQKLGADADWTRILFVTLDPNRDTPAVLHRYLTSFDPAHMVGVSGTKDNILNLVKRYRSAYRPGGETGDISHSSTVYIFDAEGRARLLFTPQDSDEDLTRDLIALMYER